MTPSSFPLGRLWRWGALAAFGACSLNGLWVATLVYLQSLGGTAEQVSRHVGIFRLSVGSCLVLTVLQVPILLAVAGAAFGRGPLRALVGGIVYALYVPINLIGYYLFGRLAPVAVEGRASELAGMVEVGGPLALTGALPVLGYGLLGTAWCLLGSVMWSRGGLWRGASALLVASGGLSVLGAGGAFVAVEALELCCLLGGVASLPALALVGLALRRDGMAEGPVLENR